MDANNVKQRKGANTTNEPSNAAGRPPITFKPWFIEKVLKTLGTMVWLLATWGLIWLLLPLRLLHPPLRLLGVKHLPLDLVQHYWAQTSLWVFGCTVEVQGLENIPSDKTTIIMPNHISNMDPFVVMGYTPMVPKFIFKKSLMIVMPVMGLLSYFAGHIPIDRNNRESAINSLHKAARQASKFNRSIVIFPEGTRSTTGKLQSFKKGGFHLAKDVAANITPVVIWGTFEIWEPHTAFIKGGNIRVKFLPQIEVAANADLEDIEKQVRGAIIKEQEKSDFQSVTVRKNWPSFGVLFLVSLVTYYLFWC